MLSPHVFSCSIFRILIHIARISGLWDPSFSLSSSCHQWIDGETSNNFDLLAKCLAIDISNVTALQTLPTQVKTALTSWISRS